MKFEWDSSRTEANLARHGVDFTEARTAFLDPRRLLAVDAKHNRSESRYFCIGRTNAGGICTVRFSMRGGNIRIIGAGYWRKGKELYEKRKT